MLNSAEALVELRSTVEKIITNILQNPTETKFRKIKSANKILQQTVISRSGGHEYLLAAGFSLLSEGEEKVYTLDSSVATPLDKRSSDQEHLSEALLWMQNTVDTCLKLSMARNGSSRNLDQCCETVIQLKLPHGAKVSGGFMRNDLLLDILQFAKSYFRTEK